MNTLKPKYWFWDTVFLKHDPEQNERMITDIEFNGSPDHVRYVLSCGSESSYHYEEEITEEPNHVILMGLAKKEK